MSKKNIALVLSGGGSKGLAQIGVINELLKHDFNITSVAGTSIGSIMGGLLAMNKLDEYTEWVKTLNQKKVWGLLDFTLSTAGLFKGEKVFQKMKSFIPDIAIENMNFPFAAVATDVLNEKDVVFTSGSFYAAIRASISIPTIFTPVKHEDSFLVDGGVSNPVPIEHIQRQKDDILVVVSLYGERMHPPKQKKQSDNPKHSSKNILGLNLDGMIRHLSQLRNTADKNSLGYVSLLNSVSSIMVHRLSHEIIKNHQPDILIEIPMDAAGTFDFQKADELIEMGEKIGKQAIEEYLKKITSNE